MIRTTIVGAMAVTLLAGVAPSAQAQGLGSLGRNIFSCERSGNTQLGGAAVGGVLGGLAGAGVAKNDTLGAILGAAQGLASRQLEGHAAQRVGRAARSGQRDAQVGDGQQAQGAGSAGTPGRTRNRGPDDIGSPVQGRRPGGRVGRVGRVNRAGGDRSHRGQCAIGQDE